MSTDSNDPSIEGDDALSEALQVFLEHRSRGSGESDTELLARHPQLRELLQPLLEDGAPGADALRPGGMIGDYRLIRSIGRGGMGEVWEAEQISLKRRVALKLLRDHVFASKHSIERFRREALAGARLQHECIVAVHAVGESNGVHFIAQELIESGRTLSNLVREARESSAIPPEWWRDIARLFAQLADALQLAHENGIIHRDIKPSNILITQDGTPKIVDFGLAMVAGESELSRTGDLSGSPYYMSPEQAAAKRVGIDARSDVFSLGATLFEALTLQRPFEGDTVAQVLTKILFDDPRDPREIRSLCPRDLAVICMKMLEKAPAQRFPSMRAVADELERHLRHEPIHARPPGVLGRAAKWSRRHPVLAASSAIVCVSLCVVTALLFETLRARGAAQTSASLARASAARAEKSAEAEHESARIAAESAAAARLEANTSSRVIDFLVNAFVESTPAKARGRELSARDVLDRGVKNIRSGLTDAAESGPRARLLESLGKVYAQLGLQKEAVELLLEARKLAEETFGRSDSHTLEVCSELARLLVDLRRGDEAVALAREVHAECVARNGEDSLEAINAEWNLGLVLTKAGRLDMAEPHLRHTLAGLTALGKPRGSCMFGLSELLRVKGSTQESFDLAREAYELCTAESGLDHPDTVNVLALLARHELNAGNEAEATKLFREVANLRACVLGPKHPVTLLARAFAAFSECKLKPAESMAEMRQIHALCLAELGPGDSTTSKVEGWVVYLLTREDRLAEVEAALISSLESIALLPDQSSLDRSRILIELGLTEVKLGHKELATSILEEVIGTARMGSAVMPNVVDLAHTHLIALREENGDYAIALEFARDRLRQLDAKHPTREQLEATIARLEQLVEER